MQQSRISGGVALKVHREGSRAAYPQLIVALFLEAASGIWAYEGRWNGGNVPRQLTLFNYEIRYCHLT